MSARRTMATAVRVLAQLRRDPRTVAMVLVVPPVLMLLLRYAFAELNLARVSLEAFAENARAIRSYQKAGFIQEGVQRQWAQRDGRRIDVVVMSILQEEYLHG